MNNNAENELKIRQQFESYRQANFDKNEKWLKRTDSLRTEIRTLNAKILANDSIIGQLKPTYSPLNKTDNELQSYFNNQFPITNE